mmetsp:Transcript_1918/g.4789  ORF Transcript_1918/g.4789 Transcript_1918/m.4789 type:complete len:232 (-) Transcript_1918:260-955(-)
MQPQAICQLAAATPAAGSATTPTSPRPKPSANPLKPPSRAPLTGAVTRPRQPIATPFAICPHPLAAPAKASRGRSAKLSAKSAFDALATSLNTPPTLSSPRTRAGPVGPREPPAKPLAPEARPAAAKVAARRECAARSRSGTCTIWKRLAGASPRAARDGAARPRSRNAGSTGAEQSSIPSHSVVDADGAAGGTESSSETSERTRPAGSARGGGSQSFLAWSASAPFSLRA